MFIAFCSEINKNYAVKYHKCSSKKSRPYVRGYVSVTTDDMYIYDDFEGLITISREQVIETSSSDIQIFMAYQ